MVITKTALIGCIKIALNHPSKKIKAALMSGGDNYTKNKIVEMMVGEWTFKKDGTEVTVKIGNRKLSITTTIKGTSTLEEISAGSQWFNDKLLFTEKQKYYVKNADEFEMILGEVKAPALNDVLWERKFERS